MSPEAKDEVPLADLVGALTRDTGLLVKQEVQLAAAEMTEKARRALRDGLIVCTGGALVFAGLLGLMAAAISALSVWLPLPIAALAVGSLAFVVGSVVAASGLASLKRIDPLPKKTLETLRDDKAWMKEQFR
jgi:hypothetical protein